MSGRFGPSKEDRHFENQLNRYLDECAAGDEDGPTEEDEILARDAAESAAEARYDELRERGRLW